MIRVVLADDHSMLRQGLGNLLATCSDIEVVGEAADGMTALEVTRRTLPEVLVLDVSMPGPGLLNLLSILREQSPRVHVLVLSTHPEEQYAIRALRAGADGYLNKQRTGDELVGAIRHVAAGRKFISAEVAEQLASELERGLAGPPHEALSDRELQVFVRLARGMTVKELSEDLSISPKTVHSYRSRIFEKTGLRNDHEIIRYAVSSGMIE